MGQEQKRYMTRLQDSETVRVSATAPIDRAMLIKVFDLEQSRQEANNVPNSLKSMQCSEFGDDYDTGQLASTPLPIKPEHPALVTSPLS